MKFIASIMVVLWVGIAVAQQNAGAPASVSEDDAETEETVGVAPGKVQAVVSNSAASVTDSASTNTVAAGSGETNAAAAAVPVKDPAKCIIAHFGFDDNLQSDSLGSYAVQARFKRDSAAYIGSRAVGENLPRFVEGKFGKALLVESAYANLFSVSQSVAGDAGAFGPLNGALLSISAEQPWQGKESLAVATKGENAEEGFVAEAAVEKAFYAKESMASAPAIVPACYVASVYLKGQGNVKIMLKDVESGKSSEPVYVDLPADWQRFHSVFSYKFPRINIGDKHENDWKNSIPTGTVVEAKLQLVCATVDSQKLNFFADGFQLEKRQLVSEKYAELSPHSWIPGAVQTAQEQFGVSVKEDYFNAWKKNGSIAFWFKPGWEARDGSGELILQIANGQLYLIHDGNRISFYPAGVSFLPYDWRNNWHHIAIAWNETGERTLYVDGMDYPNAGEEKKPIKDPEFVMAGDGVKNLSPNGIIDELTFYSTTLTLEHVKALAAAEGQTAAAKGADPLPAATAPATTPAPVEPQQGGGKQADAVETDE